MSFICKKCGKIQPNNTKPKKVIVQKRNKVYPLRRENPLDPKSTIIDNGGSGWEIVKEIKVCTDCFEKVKTNE